MTRSAADSEVRNQWRALGFFCELNRELQQWRFVGSRSGLLGLRDLLLECAASSGRGPCAPHSRLEIVSSADPDIDDHGIFGSADDFRHLADLVARKLSGAQPGGRIRIGRDYAPASDYVLALELRDDEFDPASEDVHL